MDKYLIDNNVISGFFSNKFSEKAMNFIANILDQTPNISVITQIEALSWIHTNKEKEVIIRQFVSDSNILDLNSDIAIHCVKIRRSRKIKTPDAIIAATAILHNFILLSSDNDFSNIEGLKILDPFLLS